jgi:hypothetical protein
MKVAVEMRTPCRSASRPFAQTSVSLYKTRVGPAHLATVAAPIQSVPLGRLTRQPVGDIGHHERRWPLVKGEELFVARGVGLCFYFVAQHQFSHHVSGVFWNGDRSRISHQDEGHIADADASVLEEEARGNNE